MIKITKENRIESKRSSKKGIVALKDELMKSIISFRDHVKMDGELYRTNSENLVRDILNILFGSNLINANTIKKDFVGIDLVDEDKRFVVQVSTASKMENQKKKIKETLEKFEQIKFLQQYDILLIVFILELTPNFNFKKQKPDQDMIINFDIKDDKTTSVKFIDLNHLYHSITLTCKLDDIKKIINTIQNYTGEITNLKDTTQIYSSNKKPSGLGTLDSFFKYLDVENDEDAKSVLRNDLLILSNELSKLSKSSRQVIAEIITRRDIDKKDYVRFNHTYVESKSPNPTDLNKNLGILVSQNFVDPDLEYDHDDREYHRLRCPKVSEDLFVPILEFLNNESKLKKLFENLDFSFLN